LADDRRPTGDHDEIIHQSSLERLAYAYQLKTAYT
jgi:hypothetical protein